MRYELVNKRDGEIIKAPTIKDIIDYIEDNNLTDDDITIKSL